LRKLDAPLDPINRRVSLIVQYLVKPPSDDEPPSEAPSGGKESAAAGAKPAETSVGKPAK
jgi:hypothetical protein